MKRFPRWLLFLSAAFAWLVVIEMGSYAYLRFVPGKYNHLSWYLIGMVRSFHPLFHPEGGSITPKYYPYVGFFAEGDWNKTPAPVTPDPDGWVLVLGKDKQGRQAYAAMDKPKDTIRIIALGGSTMAGMGQSSMELSIPAQLQTLLRKRYPDKKIEVLNAAYYTYIAAEEMVLLSTKLILFKPDLIVVMDGYNEFIRAYYLPDLPPLWGQFQEFMRRTSKRTQSIPGMVSQLGYLLSKRFYCLAIPRVLLFANRTHPPPALPGQAQPLDPKPYERAISDYLRMHKTMIGIARANRIPILLALQPNISYRKPLSSEEKSVLAQWNEAKPRYSDAANIFFPKVSRAYDAFIASRAEGAVVAGEMGLFVRLLDMHALFAGRAETLYVDSCHYNDQGAALVAQSLEPSVVRMLFGTQPR